ncbi:MAG: hypothetical protein QGG89_15935, partial [Vicinamibacterales bacterium]|nr:hypothetical protein [Vicinamibacterales bacterium]
MAAWIERTMPKGAPQRREIAAHIARRTRRRRAVEQLRRGLDERGAKCDRRQVHPPADAAPTVARGKVKPPPRERVVETTIIREPGRSTKHRLVQPVRMRPREVRLKVAQPEVEARLAAIVERCPQRVRVIREPLNCRVNVLDHSVSHRCEGGSDVLITADGHSTNHNAEEIRPP